MGKKLLTFALCLFLGMSVALAQNRIITGTVTGAEDGFPIPGAAVFVEGTNIGTVTDTDGKYSLKVHKGTVLKVTFFGMKDAIVPIGTEDVINVVLSIDAVGLDEGYDSSGKDSWLRIHNSPFRRIDEGSLSRRPLGTGRKGRRYADFLCRSHRNIPEGHRQRLFITRKQCSVVRYRRCAYLKRRNGKPRPEQLHRLR